MVIMVMFCDVVCFKKLIIIILRETAMFRFKFIKKISFIGTFKNQFSRNSNCKFRGCLEFLFKTFLLRVRLSRFMLTLYFVI